MVGPGGGGGGAVVFDGVEWPVVASGFFCGFFVAFFVASGFLGLADEVRPQHLHTQFFPRAFQLICEAHSCSMSDIALSPCSTGFQLPSLGSWWLGSLPSGLVGCFFLTRCGLVVTPSFIVVEGEFGVVEAGL